MLAETENKSEIADLNYELFQFSMSNAQLSIKKGEYRRTALHLYQKLFERTPKFDYKKRIEELSEP